MMLTTQQTTQALTALADFTAAQGAALQTADRARAQRLTALKTKLESRTATSDDVAKVSLELMLWQLGVARARYAEQLAPIAVAAQRGDVLARTTKEALESLLHLLDGALKALERGAAPPDVVKQLQQEARAAEASLARARQLLSRTTAGVPLTPLARQPVSASGVKLEVQAPSASPPPALKAFKLRPGALPPTGRR